MNESIKVVSKVLQDGSTSCLTGMAGILMREDLTNDVHTITLVKRSTSHNVLTQNNYLKGYWDMVIRHRSEPPKWILEEFFFAGEYKFILGEHFTDWTFECDVFGGIEKLVIETVYSPRSGMIEDFETCIKTREAYLYRYALEKINKMSFSL